MPWARLGPNRSTFVWSPGPLRRSRASLNCLRLPQRSAPPITPARLTPDLQRELERPPTRARRLRAIAFHFAFFFLYRHHGGARAQRSSAIHFQSRSIRQVSHYTLLSGCRLPWPPSCFLYQSTSFEGVLMSSSRAPWPRFRFIPYRRSCLPKTAHSSRSASSPRAWRPGDVESEGSSSNPLRSNCLPV